MLYGLSELEDNSCFEREDAEVLFESYVMSTTRADMMVKEITPIYPHSSELLELLLESTDFRITDAIINQLDELDVESGSVATPVLKCEVCRSTGIVPNFRAHYCTVGTFVILTENEDEVVRSVDIPDMFTKISCGEKAGVVAVGPLPFGVQSIQVSIAQSESADTHLSVTNNVLVISSVYECALAIDDLLDCVYWGWGSEGKWTQELENSLLELVIGVSDELETAVRSWRPMMSFVGGAVQETTKMVDVIRSDIEKALTEHAPSSIGRLHQTLVQLQDGSGSMMGIPQAFMTAISAFIRAKVSACNPAVTAACISHSVCAEYTLRYVLSLSTHCRYRIFTFNIYYHSQRRASIKQHVEYLLVIDSCNGTSVIYFS